MRKNHNIITHNLYMVCNGFQTVCSNFNLVLSETQGYIWICLQKAVTTTTKKKHLFYSRKIRWINSYFVCKILLIWRISYSVYILSKNVVFSVKLHKRNAWIYALYIIYQAQTQNNSTSVLIFKHVLKREREKLGFSQSFFFMDSVFQDER